MSRIDIGELRTLFLFEGLTNEQLQWITDRTEVRTFDTGAVICREGEPAEALWVLLDGRIRLSRMASGEETVVNETDHRGAYAGAVRAYSETASETYLSTLTTTQPSRLLRLPAEDFATFVRTELPMAVHLLDGLYMGIRNTEATVRQREHLAQLGTLSANLAHELNNPAAAAVRATGQLRARVAGMRHKLGMIADAGLDATLIARLIALQEAAVEQAAKDREPLSALQEADLEDELLDRMDDLGVTAPHDLAPVFAAAGLDTAWLDGVVEEVGRDALDGALRWLGYTLETEALMNEIEDATSRISTLVAAVKQYSYLDQATHQDIDLHPGLDSTVVMLGHKLSGVQVERDYNRTLPPVPAYAAELNQVWTNLIDNAVDAMDGRGVLRLRTSWDGDFAVVEVTDDGPGIPDEVRGRIFEPFVTTKPAGKGSGLGLENARRIVERRHGGSLSFATGPDGTTFTVRLPLNVPLDK
ncbi:MAG TPA: ATP-binding protein [Polyangiaceae bacterium]|nr:ATP-binding protein [Polyangiaceae bacterium]